MNQLIVAAVFALVAVAAASPRIRVARQTVEEGLGLPSNATAIRSNIIDTFSCEGRIYGYYADVDNECQIFHVCLPLLFPDGTEQTLKWTFICGEGTMFNQESMTCAFPELSLPCEDAPTFYSLNENFGKTESPLE